MYLKLINNYFVTWNVFLLFSAFFNVILGIFKQIKRLFKHFQSLKDSLLQL